MCSRFRDWNTCEGKKYSSLFDGQTLPCAVMRGHSTRETKMDHVQLYVECLRVQLKQFKCQKLLPLMADTWHCYLKKKKTGSQYATGNTSFPFLHTLLFVKQCKTNNRFPSLTSWLLPPHTSISNWQETRLMLLTTPPDSTLFNISLFLRHQS